MSKPRNFDAYNAGKRGKHYTPKTQSERESYDDGYSDYSTNRLIAYITSLGQQPKPESHVSIIQIISGFVVPLYNNISYVYLAYLTVTLIYFEHYSTYWQDGAPGIFKMFLLTGVTALLGFFYTSFGYFFRGRIDVRKKYGNSGWKTISASLFIVEVICPSLVLLYLNIPGYFIDHTLLSLIFTIAISFVTFMYNSNRFQTIANEEITQELKWSHDLAQKTTIETKPLPEGDHYHGNYRFLILPSIIIAAIIYWIYINT